MKLKPSLLLNSSLCIHPLTFITKELCIAATTRQFISLFLWLVQHKLQHLCLVYMTCCVTKAMPIQFIDGNELKSCRMGLTNHTRPISHHITSLVINALKGGHTHTHTYIHTHTHTHTHQRANKTNFKKPSVHLV